jgi:hypothetical protein
VILRERTTTYSYLPEARPVIGALHDLGKVVEAAHLDPFEPERRGLALSTICDDVAAVEALHAGLDDALGGNADAHRLVRWALVRRAAAGYIVVFPRIVAAPVRVLD